MNIYYPNLTNADKRATILNCHNNECLYCSENPTRIIATNQHKAYLTKSELCGSDFIPLCEEDLKEYIKNTKIRIEGRKQPLLIWEMLENGDITEATFKY